MTNTAVIAAAIQRPKRRGTEAAGVQVELLTDWAQAAGRWDWSQSASGGATFQDPCWLRAWYGALTGSNVTPLIALVSNAVTGERLALLPLIRRRHRGIRIVEFADRDLTDNNAPLMTTAAHDPAATGTAMWHALRKALRRADGGADLLRLRKMQFEMDGAAKILEELDYVYPNGIVAEADGSLIWVESYTLNVVRRKPNGPKSVVCKMPDGHIPDGLKIDINGDLCITAVAAGGVVHFTKDGKHVEFLETGGTILNCCFGKGGKLFVCDMGPFDTSGAAMTGRLVEVAVGVEGMPHFRGVIG